MAIRKPKSWGKTQPPVGYVVDWSDPINKDLKGCWLFNEGVGGTVYDASGNKNNGTLGSLATWGNGRHGKALSFPGTALDTNAVTVANSSSVNIVGKITMAAWVYPTISNAFQSLIDRSNGAGASRQYAMYLSSAGVTKVFIALGGTNIGDVVVTPNWVVNQWNFIAVTADGTNVRTYVNGVLANTTASALLPTSQTQSLYFGREVGNNFSVNGRMDLPRIWGRALSSGEIARLYSEPYAGIATPRRRLWAGPVVAAGPRTISITTTEAGDTFTAVVKVAVKLSSVALVEAGDTFAATLKVAVKLSAALVEAGDTFAATTKVAVKINAPMIEAVDVAAGTVKVAVKITGAATESGDVMAAAVSVALKLTAAFVENGDVFFAQINPPVVGASPARLSSIASINRLLTKG